MNLWSVIRVLAQCLLAGLAVVMMHWVNAPGPALFALGLLGVATVAFEATPPARYRQFWKWGLPIIAFAALIFFALLPIGPRPVGIWNTHCATIAWLVALAAGLATRRGGGIEFATRWKSVAIAWALFGDALWLAAGYLENDRLTFFSGLLAAMATIVVCKSWFRLPAPGILAANTLLLLAVVLPVTSLLMSPADHLDTPPRPDEQAYSYAAARKDPARFARWWKYNVEQGIKLFQGIFAEDTGTGARRLRPNSTTLFFQCPIHINSRGFRGKEISADKGNAYRIVALGESTTFGLTMRPQDLPWCEQLEQLIRERLAPSRPVEVINAGVPTYDLKVNLDRLRTQILPLKPDLIISYHGYNGFHLIYGGLPAIVGKPAPAYQRRPLKLLADFEHSLKMRSYRRRHLGNAEPYPRFTSDPMETEYAVAYRELTQFARTNDVRLVVATYSMAVDDRSDPDVVEFYQGHHPRVHWYIQANLVHSQIVRQLARENPDIGFVDTNPVLNGRPDYFTDLVHFAPSGEQKMAETFFEGIRKTLEEDLGRADRNSGPPGTGRRKD